MLFFHCTPLLYLQPSHPQPPVQHLHNQPALVGTGCPRCPRPSTTPTLVPPPSPLAALPPCFLSPPIPPQHHLAQHPAWAHLGMGGGSFVLAPTLNPSAAVRGTAGTTALQLQLPPRLHHHHRTLLQCPKCPPKPCHFWFKFPAPYHITK